MITLHSNRTTNSQKIIIFLEEANIPYATRQYQMGGTEHLTAEYKLINPNHKLPAIVDESPVDGGRPLTVFESGAILLYLGNKTGKFFPSDDRNRSLVTQWLIWQVAGMGPMFGQAGHFMRYAPEGEAYAIKRYSNEARRILSVMEGRLRESRHLAGDYSIADMACWPWVNTAAVIDIDLAEYGAVHQWWQELRQRPAYREIVSGEESIPPEQLKTRMNLTAEQWSNAFGERMLRASNPAGV